LAHTQAENTLRLQLFATQLAVLPFAFLDWGLSPTNWYSLPACLGLYALLALPMGLIGGAFERLWRPIGRGLAGVARQDANRIGFLVGLAATIAVHALIILWSNRFNADQIAALLAALGLIPAGLVGLALGLVARRLCLVVLPGSHGHSTGWLGALGLAVTIGLVLHRWQRPDLWASVQFPMLPYLPLLPALWIRFGQRVRAWENRPKWLVNIFPLPLLAASLWAPGVASNLVRSEGLAGHTVMLVRRSMDSDGDGFSSWLGGGDCNDANAAINPGAFDEPRDGLDQDCDGSDFTPEEVDKTILFSALPDGVEPLHNLLFVTVDTLRADRLSWYGGPNDTMPQTQKLLVDKGAAFMRAYANGVRSQRSIPSMVIGRYPSRLKWGDGGRDAVTVHADNLSLGELLKRAGFKTHAVIMEKYFAKQKGLTQGWEFHRAARIQPGYINWSKSTGAAISRYTTKMIERLSKRPDRWAIWVHYYDPHIRFARSRFGHDAKARYDESLAVTDKHLASLLKAVDLQNTLVVLASDHGQGLGTHGHHGHGSHLFEEAIHVPLIFAGKGIEPKRLQLLTENVDIVPTALNLLNLATAEAQWDGRSLVPAIFGENMPERAVFAEALPDPNTNDHAWAMLLGEHKIIHDIKRQVQTIYNLTEDSQEKAGREPSSADDQNLVRLLNAHRSAAAWINKGNYGGKKPKDAPPKRPKPDRIEGEVQVQVGEYFKLTHYALLDPPHAGARLRLRLNLTVLKAFTGRLNAMVHLDGRTQKGEKIFLNRDQPIKPKPNWEVGETREILVDFLIPRNAKGGQVSAFLGFFKPGKRKWKAVGRGVDKRGRIATMRITLR
jgi:choline-sulfatase